MTTENQTPADQQPDPAAEAAALAAKAAAAGITADTTLNINATGDKPPVKEESKADDKTPVKVEPVTYDPSGDAGLDMLLEAAGTLGLSREHPAMQAAVKGDFTLLGVELERGDVKGASRLIQLGEKAYADMATKVKTQQAEDLKAVHQEVGGEESWNSIRAWAQENADDGEKKSISAALGRGGLDARMAAAWLSSAYTRAQGVSDDGTGKTVAVVKGTPSANGALDPRSYASEVAKARIGFKGNFETSDVYRSLQARRMAWRAPR